MTTIQLGQNLGRNTPPPFEAKIRPSGTVARWPLSQRAEFSKFSIKPEILRNKMGHMSKIMITVPERVHIDANDPRTINMDKTP